MLSLNISRQEIFKVLVIVWLIAMTAYFVVDVFRKYELKKTQSAYAMGYQDAVSGVIKKAKEDKCGTFEIFSGEEKVSIVNTECFKEEEGGEEVPVEQK